jgi:hypothetical protein
LVWIARAAALFEAKLFHGAAGDIGETADVSDLI